MTAGWLTRGTLAALCGDLREKSLETLAVFFGHADGYAHAQAGFHALDEAIHLHGPIGADMGGKSCADPERVRRLNKHAIRTDVARARAQDGRSPFDLEIGAEIITRSPTALRPS